MLRKIKNTILTICFGILLYFYCILTFYTLPNIETNKNTEEKELINPIEITPEIVIVEEEKEEKTSAKEKYKKTGAKVNHH